MGWLITGNTGGAVYPTGVPRMAKSSNSSIARGDIALSPDLPGADQVTAVEPQTVMVQGLMGPLSNTIALPRAGQIWVAYEYQRVPARSIYLWHEGGRTEPINLGWNLFTVNPGDSIMWTQSTPDNAIKIAWQYAS
jgi:hypothetical protein